MRRRTVALVLLVLVAGCFPITVSVAPDGRIALVREEGVIIYDLAKNAAEVVAKPGEDRRAAWVAFSPDGRRLMWIMTPENGPGELFVADGDGRNARKLYTSGSAMAYATWSPDGTHVAVGEVSDQTKGDLGNLIGLKVIRVDSGKVSDLTKDVGLIHDWSPDSRGIVAFFVEKKAGENGIQGQLTLFALDGTKKVLAQVAAGKDLTLDCSSDSSEVLLTASVVGTPGKKDLKLPKDPEANRLFAVRVADGTAKQVSSQRVASASFSPDDKHILISTADETPELIVTDRTGADAKTLDTRVLNKTEGMEGTLVFPTWLSNDRVIYWKSRVVIGTSGKAVTTMSVRIDGSEKTNLQPKLDGLLLK